MTHDELLQLIDQAAAEGWTELDLAGKGLTELPPEIGKLTQLEVLILGKWKDSKQEGNQLESLPREIGELGKLKKLDASHNQLSKLPNEIGQLSSLKLLRLSHNRLTKIPASIGCLSFLEVFEADINKIEGLPAKFFEAENLKQINLSGNNITNLPDKIEDLVNLKALNLWQNNIRALPNETGISHRIATSRLQLQGLRYYHDIGIGVLITSRNPQAMVQHKSAIGLTPESRFQRHQQIPGNVVMVGRTPRHQSDVSIQKFVTFF